MTTRYFRYFLAIHQIWLLGFFLKNSWDWFGNNQMVSVKTPDFPTLFDFVNFQPSLIVLFLSTTIVLWLLFLFNKLNRVGQIILLMLNISIHNANPYIIHEPQQMVNLLLLIQILFLSANAKDKISPKIHFLLSGYLGIYYFLAGLKKIPDPYWLKGEALKLLMTWPPFYIDNIFSNFLINHVNLLYLLNWFTLVFELSFVFLLFTRWKFALFVIGILFHIGIFLTMDVGTFSLIMLVWYSLVFPMEDYINKIKNYITQSLKITLNV